MKRSMMLHLILKDLQLLRWTGVAALAGGLVAVALMTRSPEPVTAGGVLLVCAIVVLNIFLVMHGVVQERKDQVAVFVLSLPVSRAQYVMAKAMANLIAFGVPWLILSVAALVAVDLSHIPNGFVPFWAALLGFLFSYYCVLLSVGLWTGESGWHATAIIIGNISVNFFIMFLFSLPSVRAHGESSVAVWTTDMTTLISVEIVAGLAVLLVAIVASARRREFV